MSKYNAEQAEKKALKHLENAKVEIGKAESLADEHGFTLHFDLAYCMGGTYQPEGYKPEWANSECEASEEETGWISSSSQC